MSAPNIAGYQAYQKNKYETASPHKLILMLYEGALRYGKQASQALAANDIGATNEAIQKMQDIIYELIASLNETQGGDIAQNLKNLYLYMIDRLVQANLKKDVEALTEVMGLITEIKLSWEQIGRTQTYGYNQETI